jgi:hypothetical protein
MEYQDNDFGFAVINDLAVYKDAILVDESLSGKLALRLYEIKDIKKELLQSNIRFEGLACLQ